MKRTLSSFGLVFAFIIHASIAAAEPTDLANFLPNNTSVYLRVHGAESWGSAWQQTAAKKAIVESGALEFARPLLDAALLELLKGEQPIPQATIDKYRPLVEQLLAHVTQHGLALGADVRILAGEICLVLPSAANTELAKNLDATVREIVTSAGLTVTEEQHEGRAINVVKTQLQGLTVFLSWWNEGPHLLLVGNQLGPKTTMRRIAGKADGLSKSPRLAKLQPARDYSVAIQGWIDAQLLLKLLPQTMPEVRGMTEMLALKGLLGAGMSLGFEGNALRSDWDLFLTKERLGLWKGLGSNELASNKLPKLPADVDHVYAAAIDPTLLFDIGLDLVTKYGEIFPESGYAGMKETIAAYEVGLGYQIRDEIIASLGNELVAYSSPTDGLLVFGANAAIAVKDRDMLTGALDRLVDLVGLIDSNFLLEKHEADGNTYWIMGKAGSNYPFAPTFALSDNWLVIAPVSPASARHFFDAQKQTSGTWDIASTLAKAPKATGKVTGLMYLDPKPAIEFGLSMMPVIVSGLRNNFPRAQLDLMKTPRANIITENAFPGIAVTTTDDAGVHCSSRYSFPLTNPEIGAAMMGAIVPLFPYALITDIPLPVSAELKLKSGPYQLVFELKPEASLEGNHLQTTTNLGPISFKTPGDF